VAGIPLDKTIRMLTLTPARVIGYDDRKGSLEPGKRLTWQSSMTTGPPWRTMIGRRWVYAG